MTGSTTIANASDQTLVRAKSPAGRPSTSQITRTGSGCASAAIRSNGASAGKPDSRSSVTAPMRSRSASITGGLNAPLTSRRSRVCLGGSLNSIHCSVTRSNVESARKGRTFSYIGERHGSRLSLVLRNPALQSAW